MWGMTRQAIFLERDGVLIEPNGYIKNPDQVTFLPGSIAALQRVDPEKFDIFITTDQPGIAFGAIGERRYKKLTDWLVTELAEQGVAITKIYTCPFHPGGRGKWKKQSVFAKPNIGTFKMAQQEYDLDLRRCWMIGHQTKDVLAAQRAGVPDIMLRTGDAGQDGEYLVDPTFIADDLASAMSRIIHQEASLLK